MASSRSTTRMVATDEGCSVLALFDSMRHLPLPAAEETLPGHNQPKYRTCWIQLSGHSATIVPDLGLMSGQMAHSSDSWYYNADITMCTKLAVVRGGGTGCLWKRGKSIWMKSLRHRPQH